MIVNNTGYLSFEQVKSLKENYKNFGIYRTHKDTMVLIKYNSYQSPNDNSISIYALDESRYPYKILEGKHIASCYKVYDSKEPLENIDLKGWNNGNQIMSYEEYDYSS